MTMASLVAVELVEEDGGCDLMRLSFDPCSQLKPRSSRSGQVGKDSGLT